MKIEFVFFDLGNVLIEFNPQVACRNVSELTGLSMGTTEAHLFEGVNRQPGLQQRYETGQIDEEEYADAVRELASGDWTTDQLMLAISDMFTPIESMSEVIAEVRSCVPRIGLLSNTCPAHWKFVRRQPWRVSMVDFDVIILSFEARSMKPDAVIYEQAEKAAAVRPGSILFLDDKEENVLAARERGWLAEQCLGGDQARDALKNHLPALQSHA
ncbi:MAG: HAD family phosphatase [Planctomycetota bacterium]